MLKAHRAAGCLTSIASALFGLTALIRRHLALGRTDSDEIENENEHEHENDALVEGMGREKENPAMKTGFYFCTKMFLWVSVILLGFGFFNFYRFFFYFLKIPKFIKKKKTKTMSFWLN